MRSMRDLQPTAINIAKQPLCYNPTIKTLPLNVMETFIAKRRDLPKFTWQEWAGDTTEIDEKTFLDLQASSKKLVLCEMGNLGLGVFTKEKILAGTTVAIYAGELVTQEEYSNKDYYFFRIGDPKQEKFISARKCGNIASFFQHLPSSEGEAYYTNDVAFKNLDTTECGDMIILVATRDIEENEMLGYNYCNDYWDALHAQPEYLSKFGVALSPTITRFSFMKVYEFLYPVAELLLRSNECKNYHKLSRACQNEIKQTIYDQSEESCARFLNKFEAVTDLESTVHHLLLYSHIDFLKLIPEKYRDLAKEFICRFSLGFPTNELNKICNFPKNTFAIYLKQNSNQVKHTQFGGTTTRFHFELPEDYFQFCETRYYVYFPVPKDTSLDALGIEAKKANDAAMAYYKKNQFDAAIKKWNASLSLLRSLHFIGSKEVFMETGQVLPINQDALNACWNMGTVYYKNLNNLVDAEFLLNLAAKIAMKLAGNHVVENFPKYKARLVEVREKMGQNRNQHQLR